MCNHLKRLLRTFRYGPDLIIESDEGSEFVGQGSVKRGYPRSYIRIDKGSFINLSVSSIVKPGNEIRVNLGGRFMLGSRSYISPGGRISCIDQIKIGHDTAIGRDVLIRDHDGPDSQSPVVIGGNVHVGDRAVILKGAVIGDGSQVGAGSVVVSGHYPPNSLIVGNPATVKRLDHSWTPTTPAKNLDD